MVKQEAVREGMAVHAADGRQVGVVVGIGDTHFEMERPGVLPLPRRDYLVEYSDVARVRGHAVYLRAGAEPRLEEDDDGGALPPRHHAGLDAEPVNAPEAEGEPSRP